mmetsp:Transcript_42284/g.73466  ORF Transcript_42284/g.73466 Transcript_42284/m.73466 type:complete len:254 (-) Transcript_42284:25-786(-)
MVKFISVLHHPGPKPLFPCLHTSRMDKSRVLAPAPSANPKPPPSLALPAFFAVPSAIRAATAFGLSVLGLVAISTTVFAFVGDSARPAVLLAAIALVRRDALERCGLCRSSHLLLRLLLCLPLGFANWEELGSVISEGLRKGFEPVSKECSPRLGSELAVRTPAFSAEPWLGVPFLATMVAIPCPNLTAVALWSTFFRPVTVAAVPLPSIGLPCRPPRLLAPDAFVRFDAVWHVSPHYSSFISGLGWAHATIR